MSTKQRRVGALVPAAGRGDRLGPDGPPKALRLLDGVPLLVHAVAALISSRTVDVVVVAAPVLEVAAVDALLRAAFPVADVRVVAGGPTRQDSVAAALAELPGDVTVVLVHDAARPLVPPTLVDAIVDAVTGGAAAAVPGLPVVDTLKQVDLDGRVLATPPRGQLRAVQTPQGFRRELLEAAHAAARALPPPDPATDDAGLVERLGAAVQVVPGSEEAFKVTRPLDLLLADAVLARRRARVR